MSANAFDTLKAAKSLEAAGFDEAQAEEIVATVGDAVRVHTEPLAGGISAIEQRMATKEDVAAVRDEVATVAGRVETISGTMATKDEVATLSGNMATKDEVATLSGNMATKDQLATLSGTMATKDEVATLSGNMATKDQLATLSGTMATKDYVDAALARHRAEIAVDFRNLYRHLWVMGTGFVGITVALIKLLP